MVRIGLGAVAGVALCALGATSVQADPPPWAPAHGWRAKHAPERIYALPWRRGPERPYGIGEGTCYKQTLGTLLGGGAGAVVGSTIGKGSGRIVAIVGGTILGALAGGAIGREMDEVDQNCIGQALEHAPDGRRIVWRDPANSRQYAVSPVATYKADDGRYCREYTATADIGGKPQQTYGTACRQPDGSWQIVN